VVPNPAARGHDRQGEPVLGVTGHRGHLDRHGGLGAGPDRGAGREEPMRLDLHRAAVLVHVDQDEVVAVAQRRLARHVRDDAGELARTVRDDHLGDGAQDRARPPERRVEDGPAQRAAH
jgi:hypothetical protein